MEVHLREGTVSLSSEECELFNILFTVVDSDCDSAIGGAEGACFLRRAGLSDEVLSDVWRLACGGMSRPKLELNEWIIACKLVSIAQSGFQPLTRDFLFNRKHVLPLPYFGVDPQEPEYSGDQVVTLGTISVRLTNASIVGSGLDRHVVYTVSLRTNMKHFPRPTAIVSRRYSDFRWLHKRLLLLFPGTVVPPLPPKRLWGNTDQEFIDERRAALEHYINHVSKHPLLTKCFEVTTMLDASTEGLHLFRDMIKRNLLAKRELESEGLMNKVVSALNRDGGSQLNMDLNSLPLSVSRISVASSELKLLEHRFESLINIVEKLVHTHKTQTAVLSKVSATLEPVFNDELFALQLKSSMDSVIVYLNSRNDKFGSNFLVPLKFHLGRVRSVKTVIRNHDSFISSLKTAHEKYIQRKNPSDRDKIEKCKENLVNINRSLGEELDKYQIQNTNDMRGLIETYVLVQIESCNALQHAFNSIAKMCSGGDESQQQVSRRKVSMQDTDCPRWLNTTSRNILDI